MLAQPLLGQAALRRVLGQVALGGSQRVLPEQGSVLLLAWSDPELGEQGTTPRGTRFLTTGGACG